VGSKYVYVLLSKYLECAVGRHRCPCLTSQAFLISSSVPAPCSDKLTLSRSNEELFHSISAATYKPYLDDSYVRG